jgi:hypothetical protein
VLAAVYGWIMDRMPRFRARQVSRALYAISRLNLYNEELVAALIQVGSAKFTLRAWVGRLQFVLNGFITSCSHITPCSDLLS